MNNDEKRIGGNMDERNCQIRLNKETVIRVLTNYIIENFNLLPEDIKSADLRYSDEFEAEFNTGRG